MSTPNIHFAKTGYYVPACIFITLIFIASTAVSCLARQKRQSQSREMQLLKEKQARTAVEQKIDSRLLQAIKEAQKTASGISPESANVHIDINGKVAVDISATVTDSLLNNIRALGGQIIFPSKEYHTIRAQVPLLKVETIAGYPAVTFIQPAAQPTNNGATPGTSPGSLHPPPVKDPADTPPNRQ